MPQDLQISETLFVDAVFQPSVVTWNRLEGRPRTANFQRSLRAEVRDPLWMLTRQWQFGEFRGEDAGSAVSAKLQVNVTSLNRFSIAEDAALAYDATIPLEARVEAETIPMDLRTRIQIGRHWLRLLQQSETLISHHPEYLSEYPIEEPASAAQQSYLQADIESLQYFRMASGRYADGGRLLADVRSGAHDNFVENTLPPAARNDAKKLATDLVKWFDRVYFSPGPDEPSGWRGDYLEYQFACAAQSHADPTVQIVLTADQYHHGDLDWYAFDRIADPLSRLTSADESAIPSSNRRADKPLSFVPAPVEFAGMPAVRWWQFEDGRIDLGNINAATTDLVSLVLADFALIYSNDWIVMPYDTSSGALLNVSGLVVTDTFGIKTLIQSAGTDDTAGGDSWSMFNMMAADAGRHSEVFLAPVVSKRQEGGPIERVLIARDEMANMVWGVEQTIPGPLGTGIDGFQAVIALERHRSNSEEAAATPSTAAADIAYRLGSDVYDNWIPFIPVHNPGSNREIRLQRGAMPRFDGSQGASAIEPRGRFLRGETPMDAALQEYFVNEEAIPRAGLILTRSFQRARWWGGRIYTWLGRRKQSGRGEASSGLQFDNVVYVSSKSEET